MDIVDKIIAWEEGTMELKDQIEFFSELIKTNKINSLQGGYQRFANTLIANEFLDTSGDITLKDLEG